MAWYSDACRNNAAFLGVAVALIALCWFMSIFARTRAGAALMPDDDTRHQVQGASFQSAVIIFLIAMLVLFACANGSAASAGL